MGRVETRMYRRKRQRTKKLRLVLLLLVLVSVGLLIWRKLPGSFLAEYIQLPTPTPLGASFDQTMDSREVTLAAETWYAIQTGVFSTEEAAIQKADAYTERGAPGSVIRDGEKWRVFIACYGTEEQAAAVRTRLEEKQKVDTYLYAWQCPELRLRLSGMIGQMDVVEAGFTMLNSSASALRDNGIRLDAGELTTTEASAAVGELQSQLKLWRDTTRSCFGNKMPTLVQGMLDMTETWSADMDALKATANATEMSAGLKAQAISMYDDLISWRNALAAE